MYQVARAGLRIRMSQMRKTKDTCEPRSQHMHDTNTNQAVVLGASLAGLLAARVLSERFERVVVIERDVLPRPAGTAGACRTAGICMACTRAAGRSSMSCSRGFPPR